MDLDDLQVEVRDKNLNRLGFIRSSEMNLEVYPEHNGVGVWKLTLPANHPMTAALRTPGSGLIVTGPTDVILSGPTVKPEFSSTPEDPNGSVIFDGVGDNIYLQDALAFPNPAQADPKVQGRTEDTFTAPAETVMHYYVNANLGPGAPAARRKPNLVMGRDLGRGTVMTKTARFPEVSVLLTEVATIDGLGFRIVQRGPFLVFETYTGNDRTREVRLDSRPGGLAGQRVATIPPTVTRVILGSGNDDEGANFTGHETPQSLQAEDAWGRRVEKFVSGGTPEEGEEVTQAADEALAEGGKTGIAVQAIPADNSIFEFGRDWTVGDKVTVEIDGEEMTAVASGVAIKANSDGFRLGVVLGEDIVFSPAQQTAKKVSSLGKRISALERGVTTYASTPSAGGGESTPPMNFQFASAATSWTCNHNLNQIPVDVVTYDANGAEVVGDVSYPTPNTAVIEWFYATAGSAIVKK